MNNGHPQPPPHFAVHIDPATGQMGVTCNVADPWVLLQMVGVGLLKVGQQRMEPPKPNLVLAQELPRITGPLRGEGPQEVS